MKFMPNRMRLRQVAARTCCLCVLAIICSAPSARSADEASVHKTITVGSRKVKLTFAVPKGTPSPPPYVVIFASGDGGLKGVSKEILEHLAGQRHWVAGFSSPEAFKGIGDDSKQPNYAAARDRLVSIIRQAKEAMGVPDKTAILLTGMSRGANVVVAGAGDAALKPGIVGAIAIALTREFDDLTVADSVAGRPGIQADDKGRLQTYPALQRLESLRLAVVQSTNDSYVKSSESRRLLGPDTPTRRLYEIDSKNHSFGGGKPALMHALDEAVAWAGGSLTAP